MISKKILKRPSDIFDTAGLTGLRPGYTVVASGGFMDHNQAQRCLQVAMQLGVKDSYIKRLW